MFGKCMSLVSSCLYGEGDWTSTPEIPASQPIPGTGTSLHIQSLWQEGVVMGNSVAEPESALILANLKLVG